MTYSAWCWCVGQEACHFVLLGIAGAPLRSHLQEKHCRCCAALGLPLLSPPRLRRP